jgi:hypothetical protein
VKVNIEIISSGYFGKGTISFSGHPKYNPIKKVIYFGDLSFKTQFGFVSSLAFSIFQFFSSNIENVAIYDISWLYKYEFNQEMSKIDNVLEMSLQLQDKVDVDPIQFLINEEMLDIQIMLAGKFHATMEKFPKQFSLM